MSDPDLEPEPGRRPPMLLWVMLGLLVVVAFAAIVVVLGGHGVAPRAVGPPAGAP